MHPVARDEVRGQTFDAKYLNEMERLVVLREARWPQAIAAFAKRITTAEIRYCEADQARQWASAP